MDFASTNWEQVKSDSAGRQASSPAVPSADAATFERQLSEIANLGGGGGGGAMPAASTLQPVQSAGVLIGHSKEPLYSEDARLISVLEKGLRHGNAANHTANGYVYSLRSFSRRLFANKKDPIAARLDDQSLTDDAREAVEKGHDRRLLSAIDHLRTFQSTGGIVPIKGCGNLNPHPQDGVLIEEYKNQAVTPTRKVYAAVLRNFSDYLRENNKPGIAGRLSGMSLDGDVRSYRKDGGDRNIGPALADLRKSQAGAKVMEIERQFPLVPAAENAVRMEPMPVGSAAAQHSASQAASRWPDELPPVESYDQDLLWEMMDRPGPSSSLEPAARHDQSSDPRESIRHLNWGYDHQQFPDEPMGGFASSNLLPSGEVVINDERVANSGGGSGGMPASSALQPPQSAGVSKGNRKQPLYFEDARLISELALSKGNANAYVYSLRRFGRWLFANNKDPIAARLDDQSLTDDAREAIDKGHHKRLLPAMDHLRTLSMGGVVPIEGRPELNPHPQDRALIKEYKNGAGTSTGSRYAALLRSFSDYLRENNKPAIAARLSGTSLDGDVKSYRKDAAGDRNIGAALADLRKSQAGVKAMELERHILPVPDSENAVRMEPKPVSAAAAQQEADRWPEELPPVEGYDQDLLWEMMDKPGPSSSQPAARRFSDNPIGAFASSNLLPGEEVLINDERDTAGLRPAKRPRPLDNLPGLAIERQLSEIANSGGAIPATSTLRPAQSAGVRIGRRRQRLYSEDAHLISGLEKALLGGNAINATASAYVSSLRGFGRWLFANNKDPIAARLNEQSLTDDMREAIETGYNVRLRPAMDHLRIFQSTGNVPIASRAELNPHPQDVALIKEYKNEAAPGTGSKYAAVLRSFSDYLRENNKPGIAARLSGTSLDGDLERYRKDAAGDRNIGAALADLRKSQAGAKAMGLERHILPVPAPAKAVRMEPMPVGRAAAQHSVSQGAGRWPAELPPVEGYDQDLLWEMMDEPGPSSSLQPAKRLQSTGVLIGRSKQPLYSEDAGLISGLEKALFEGNAADGTADAYVSSLRSFGRWLFAKNKDPIAARLDDRSLTDDVREAIETGHNGRLRPAMDHLRNFQSTGGVVPITGRPELNPHPQDVALIKEYKNEAATGTRSRYAVLLRSFSDYLRESNKPGIAARLSGTSLDGDVERYRKDAGGNRNVGAALADLRKSQAGAKAMELERHNLPVPDPAKAIRMEPMPVSGAAVQHSVSQEADRWPDELPPVEGYDQNLLWEMMDKPGPSLSLEPAPRHDQSSDPRESVRHLNWGHDPQQFPDKPMGVFASSNLPPSEEVLINNERDTAGLRPAKRPRTLDNPDGLERQLSEIANSGGRLMSSADPIHQLGALPSQAQDIVQAGRQEPARFASTGWPQMPLNFDWSMWPNPEAAPAPAASARPDTYRDFPLVDLTAATPSESRDDDNSVPVFASMSSDAQIGALGPTAPSHGRGLVLQDMEWLGDEHVLRDYQLLTQELQGNNPGLAARTRFVDPLITLGSLRLGTESDMLGAFQRIVHDHNGDDTADFLFLPLNDASANRRGSHWSLLFVDRRERERPVAYHYDSNGRYNEAPAGQLAARLGARLESPRIPQQRNGHDCGVFVVDGTRELVRRLAQPGQPVQLDLDGLRADRQALQNRLRG